MAHWLYRYIFRGAGILLIVGMLTFLILAAMSLRRQSGANPTSTPTTRQP